VTDPGVKAVTPINLATNTAGTPITLTGPISDSPTSIAITPNGTAAYVAGNMVVWPINLATKTAGTPIPVDYADDLAITPNGATAYVTDPFDNLVTPINLATNTPETPITGVIFPEAIAITPNGATAFVSSGGGGTVTPINLATNTPGTPITLAGVPANGPINTIAITPNGTTAYVTQGQGFSNGAGDVIPINTSTDTAGTPIPVDTNPNGIAITPNGATAYVTIHGCISPPPPAMSTCSSPPPPDNIVTPINLSTNVVGAPITVGLQPGALAITPDQAPVAHLSVTPAQAGQPTGFDASASTVAVGTITTYAWKFGDGSMATTSTPTTTHAYLAAGPYKATVTETDSAGTSTTQTFTGQTMSNNGGPSAAASQSFTVSSPPTTSVLLPPAGATLSGSTALDASASNATSVEFRLFGGIYGYDAPVICTATPTYYGWLCSWNTTAVPNGTYYLMSEGFNPGGSAFSSGVEVTLSNPPTTSVVLPSNGATLTGSTTLDASATNATIVEFELFGGIYGYDAPVLCTATLTDYGWSCSWNTSTVPNGSYVLVSEAFNSAGSAFSSGVDVTVTHPVNLTDLAGSFTGTQSPTFGGNGCEILNLVFDATYPGSSAVGSVTLQLSGCVEPTTYTGTFSITTSVGTLSGDVAGTILNVLGPPPMEFELGLSVLSGTGAFADASGTLDVNILAGSSVTGTVTVP
jgi:DNA-binding beta-propeller fold protein YncE